MAGQGNFNPHCLPGNFPVMASADQNQPVYPMDYRQYPGYVSSRHLGLPRQNQPHAGFDMSLNNRQFFQNTGNTDFNDLYNSQAFANNSGPINLECYNSQRKNASTYSFGHDVEGYRNVETTGNGFQNTVEDGRSPVGLELGEVRSLHHENVSCDRHMSPTDPVQSEFNYLLKEDNEEVEHKRSQNDCYDKAKNETLDEGNENEKSGEEHVAIKSLSDTKEGELILKTDIKIEIDNPEEGEFVEYKNKDDHEDEKQPTVEDSDSDADTIIEEPDKFPEKKGKKKIYKTQEEQPAKSMTPNKNEKKEYKCETCSRVLNSARALEKHTNLHTGKFTCEICKKFCNSQTSLDTHAKVHQGFIGNEICNVCDKKFYDKSSLNKHTLSVHMGIKNFQCSYCDLSFYARKTYEEHVRVHTGERPFKCEMCPKSYKRISDLNHHIRLHKGETSHTCEVCGEGFRRISELKRHKQKHENMEENGNQPIKEHRCEWCGVIFSTSKAMTMHIKTHFESIGMKNRMSCGEPDRFTKEKRKLVDEIVQDLSKRKIDEELINRPGIIGQNPNTGQNIGNEAAIPEAQFGFSGLGGAFQASWQTRIETGASQNDVVANYQFETLNSKSLESVINTAGIHVSKVIESINNAEETNKNDINKEIDTLLKCDTVKTEEIKTETIEIKKEPVDFDYDDDFFFDEPNDSDGDGDLNYPSPTRDDYGSDTEIEEYKYVIKDSENVDGGIERIDKTPPKKSGVKRKRKSRSKKVEKDQYTDTDKTNEPDDPNVENKKGIKNKRKRVRNGKKVLKPKVEKDDPDFDTGIGIDKKEKSSEPSSFICEECGKFFSRKACFQKHTNLHTGIFTCGLCSKSFASQNSLDLHLDNHEGKRMKTAMCNVCDKSFYDHSSLNKHMKNVHMNWRPFPCSDCDLRFSEKKTLVEHIRTHTGERPFKCVTCERTFKRQSELNFHAKKHTGETKLTCSECGHGFRRHSELRNHMIIKHTGDKPFMCSFCGRKFMSNAMLKEHILTHSSQKSFECEKCGKGFHSKFKLGKHMRIKSDCTKKQVEMINGVCMCKYCCTEFTSVRDLQRHIHEMHEGKDGLKTFNCKVCWKEFSRSQALKRHLKIHSQQRDYKCFDCGASFIQKHHLTQHLRTHSGEKPFQCEKCLKSFAQSATLYSHMKHH